MFFQIEGLTFKHPQTGKNASPALKNVSFEIDEGEWVALIGSNGSGKTTLARQMNGLLLPDSGKVLVKGMDTSINTNLPEIRSLVGMVFQSPEDQIISSMVIEDTAFGLENLGVPSKQINERIEESLRAVGMWEYRDRPPHLLSAGQIQRVALAGVLAMRPRCIIFDETTAMLDPMGRHEVLNQMQSLHKQGITIIMITHSMDEASQADRVILLDKGRLMADGPVEEIFEDVELVSRCHLELPGFLRMKKSIQNSFSIPIPVSKNLESIFKQIPLNQAGSKQNPPGRDIQTNGSSPVITITGLEHTYMKGTPFANVSLEGVSLNTYPGKVHGLVGATGSGKSTLLQHLNGLYLPQAGKMRVGAFDLNDSELDVQKLRRYVGMVFQNPEAFFFEQYVGDEIAYGPKLLHGREGLRDRVKNAMGMVNLDFDDFKDRLSLTLSGGEKRKVALASALAMDPGLLVLDEPTAGLDPFSRKAFLKTLKTLQLNGLEIVLSTHNMDDIAEMAQNVTMLSHGRSLASGSVGDILIDAALMKKASLVQPLSVVFANALRERGWPIPLADITIDQIENSLAFMKLGVRQ